MGFLVEKFNLYTCHLKEFIDDNAISKVKAAVREKLDKLLERQVLHRSTFLKYLLTSATIFCWVTQKRNPNVHQNRPCYRRDKKRLKQLLKKFHWNQNLVYVLPKFKTVTAEIECHNNNNGELIYQDEGIKRYL